jgi:hypothetical protein
MRLLRLAALLIFCLAALAGGALAAESYSWRGIQVQKATAEHVKKALGEPTTEYREQLLYENQIFDPADPNGQNVRLNTIVLNIGVKGIVESIFMSPEWGTTDQDVRSFFGNGKKSIYRKFLAAMGDVKVGAGTRPNEKLHYVDLDSPCEVFAQSRVLMLYHRQDVVSGNYLLQFILFY